MADDFSRLPFSASGGDLQLTGQVLPPCGRIWCLPFFLQMLLPLGGKCFPPLSRYLRSARFALRHELLEIWRGEKRQNSCLGLTFWGVCCV